MHDSLIVENYYDNIALEEGNRLDRHKIEFSITKRILSNYITKKGSNILDIGGGQGRYSIWLSAQGHYITLIDLSKANTNLAQEKAKESNIEIKKIIHGNAIKLDEYVNEQFDYILLMGPLYHLTNENDRKSVVNKALDCLKDDGIIFISFISAYAPILDLLKNYPEEIKVNAHKYYNYLTDGRNIVSKDNQGFTNAYFFNPNDIDGFMKSFALEKLGLYGVESILGPFENIVNKLKKELYDESIELAMKFVETQDVWACNEHFLYVGKNSSGFQHI